MSLINHFRHVVLEMSLKSSWKIISCRVLNLLRLSICWLTFCPFLIQFTASERFCLSVLVSAEPLSIRVQPPCTFLQTSVSLSWGLKKKKTPVRFIRGHEVLHPPRDVTSRLASSPKWMSHHTPWIIYEFELIGGFLFQDLSHLLTCTACFT